MTQGFDYSAAAELFPGKGYRGSVVVGYRRFDKAAEALRYAIEEMPSALLKGAMLEVNEERFNGDEVLELYRAENFPLERLARTV